MDSYHQIHYSIPYPNPLADAVVMIGYLSPGARSFLIRPKWAGVYLFTLWTESKLNKFIWPVMFAMSQRVVESERCIPTDVLIGPGCPPHRIVFDLADIPESYQSCKQWNWTVTPISPDIHSNVEMPPLRDIIQSKFPTIAHGIIKVALSTQVDPTTRKRITFWSCHQPYRTFAFRPKVNKICEDALGWYSEQVEMFQPSLIWGMGDTAYSDGVPSTDFVDSFFYSPKEWHKDPLGRAELREHYRRMYLYHWSFSSFQQVARNFAHMLLWDDHEIRDGWGSHDSDFSTENRRIMFAIGRSVASEFVFPTGPRLKTRYESDAQMAVAIPPFALFGFDTRSSRNYVEHVVISDEQKTSFEEFLLGTVVPNPQIKHLILSTSLPLVYLRESLEIVGSRAKTSITDDIRDSWASPNNQRTMEWLFSRVSGLQKLRPDINCINLGGDIHIANAFKLKPAGFTNPLFQVTSSALTNRTHVALWLRTFISVGDVTHFSDQRGTVFRIWPDIDRPNFLNIEADLQYLVITLKVFDEPDRRLIFSNGNLIESKKLIGINGTMRI